MQLADLVHTARHTTQMTPAEFDYSLASHDGRALGALYDACYTLTPDTGDPIARGKQSRDTYDALWPEIEELITAANGKNYTGWSLASKGPIQYADDSAS